MYQAENEKIKALLISLEKEERQVNERVVKNIRQAQTQLFGDENDIVIKYEDDGLIAIE